MSASLGSGRVESVPSENNVRAYLVSENLSVSSLTEFIAATYTLPSPPENE